MEEVKKKNTLRKTMRSLHRDLGFFVVGLVIIYTVSGIVLIFRDTELFKHEVLETIELPKQLTNEDLSSKLKIKEFKIKKEEAKVVYFENGFYNKETGVAKVKKQRVYFPINKFIDLHKTRSVKTTKWLGLSFCGILLFLAVSSLWMFKPGNVLFKRGLSITLVGIIIAILILFL